jgi:hypothetical protein
MMDDEKRSMQRSVLEARSFDETLHELGHIIQTTSLTPWGKRERDVK